VVTQFVYRFYTLGRLDDLHPEPPSDIDNSLSLARIREDNGRLCSNAPSRFLNTSTSSLATSPTAGFETEESALGDVSSERDISLQSSSDRYLGPS